MAGESPNTTPDEKGIQSVEQDGEAYESTRGRGSDERMDGPNRKRRRRILSCETCRRLKCRCVFEEGYGICSRCRTLRIPCIKPDDDISSTPQQPTHQLSSEARLESLEKSVLEIRTMIEEGNIRPNDSMVESICTHMRSELKSSTNISNVRHSSSWADRGVTASPAEVVRRVGNQLNGGYRRTLDSQTDLVSLGLLTEEMARGLITLFFQHRQTHLVVDDIKDLAAVKNIRESSPFLHAVCCLQGIRNSVAPSDTGSQLHRQVYEHVRRVLGQVMLASKLPLEELSGILYMAKFSAAPSQGPEYIDSWLLSGHCAQQAMLSTNFSEIMSRTGHGTASPRDQKFIRLWAHICLLNLQWAAGAGRPPVIPPGYLKQCKILLEFGTATLTDGMLFAEISLYSILNETLVGSLDKIDEGVSEELTAWRQKWDHLFISSSMTLNISYQIARLILARRSLEFQDEHEEFSSPTNMIENEENRHREGSRLAMQAFVYESAFQVLKVYHEMPSTWADDLPGFYLLCVAYALLVLSKYEHPTSSNEELFRILASTEKRCSQSKTVPLVLRFSMQRALEKVAERTVTNRSREGADLIVDMMATKDTALDGNTQDPLETLTHEQETMTDEFQSSLSRDFHLFDSLLDDSHSISLFFTEGNV